jgi:hypothetical protein
VKLELKRHRLTFLVVTVLVLSAIALVLISAGVVGNGGVWRLMGIPAYLVMLASAVLATKLSVTNNPGFWLLCAMLFLLPFAAIDTMRKRRRDQHT